MIEHQALHLRCPVCQAVTVGRFPAEVPSWVQYGPQLRALAVYLVQQRLAPYGRARELLERLWLGRDEALAFLDDLTLPLDNNQAERDLRMLKVQQKVSGCFRSTGGATAFVRIRRYLSSLSKQKVKRLAALESLFTGQLLYPGFG